MNINKFSWLRSIYYENTLVSIIILALVLFFIQMLSPEEGTYISRYLIPVFIIFTSLEIYFLRTYLSKDISDIKSNLESDFLFKSFSSGKEFDNYLANRLLEVNVMQVIHIGSYVAAKEDEDRRYSQIIRDFVKTTNKTNQFERIFCNTSNNEVFSWIQSELMQYIGDDNYNIYYTDKITTDDIRTTGVIILDDEEVILGGPHRSTFQQPLISIKNSELVKFYQDYFKHLLKRSRSVTHDNELFER